ncbi:Retrotransposon nucleocapsid protein, related [Eimeria brunetti]|uniref:Retrotransposon nucleocapsid protein, related n=1 Tax=Eimeria brunetti TaxID=51314 RepID=U6LHJ6_9EIME|nr:Retrotransposon nucleocapsid protein, related [Eimeria brunetti]
MSSAYHPQSGGQAERVNRTLEQMLRTYIQTDEREWERLLPALELSYNTTSHSSTELSPFEAMIGQNPLTAADLDVFGNLAPTLTPSMTKLFRQLYDGAPSHILKAKRQQKMQADARRRDVQYSTGDLVWISSRNLPGLNQFSKFEPRFRGPFSVVERIGQVAYRVALPPTYTCHNVLHVSQLVPDRPRDPQMTSKEAAVGWLPLTDPAGRPTDLYAVDYILAQRGAGPSAQYLVKWRGVPEDRATWEPATHFTNCPALLRAWRRHLRKAQRSTRASPAADRPALSSEPPALPSSSGGDGDVEWPPPGSRSSSSNTQPAQSGKKKSTAAHGEARASTPHTAEKRTCLTAV